MYRVILSLFFVFSYSIDYAQKVIVCCGSITTIDSFSSKNIGKTRVDVWLPKGYSFQKKYPVIYMQDGQSLFDSFIAPNKKEWYVDETMNALIKKRKIKEAIVVGIWNAIYAETNNTFSQKNTNKIISPTKDTLNSNPQLSKDELDKGGKLIADSFINFLVNELKPFIDKHFSTLPNANNTFIAGKNIGALMALYAICEYPKIFGGAACFSTYWTSFSNFKINTNPSDIVQYLCKNLPNPNSHKLYFDYESTGIDTVYKPFQLIIDACVRKKGYKPYNWKSIELNKEINSNKAFNSRLVIPFQFFFK